MAEFDTTPDVAPSSPAPEAPSAPEPSGNIDDLISQTLDKMLSDEPGPDDGDDAPTETRTRDERGRFIAKDAAPDDQDTDPDASVEPDQPETAKTDAPSEGHFRGWTPEKRAKFETLTPEAKSFVLEHQKDLQGHSTRVSQEFSDYQKSVDPYLDVYRQNSAYFEQVSNGLGIPPQQIVNNLINTEYTLRAGTYQDKVATLSRLAKDYGIPVTISDQDPLAEPTQTGGEAYPVIHDLRQQVSRLEGQLQSYQRQQDSAAQTRLVSAVKEFAEARDAQGNPLHPHYERVRGVMGSLLSSGQAATLQDAYAQAVAPIMEAAKAEAERVRKANEQALAKARRVQPVRTTGAAPGGKTNPSSLDDLINSTLTQAGW